MKVCISVLRSRLSTQRRRPSDEDHHRCRDCHHYHHHRGLNREGNEALSVPHTTTRPPCPSAPHPCVLCVFRRLSGAVLLFYICARSPRS